MKEVMLGIGVIIAFLGEIFMFGNAWVTDNAGQGFAAFALFGITIIVLAGIMINEKI